MICRRCIADPIVSELLEVEPAVSICDCCGSSGPVIEFDRVRAETLSVLARHYCALSESPIGMPDALRRSVPQGADSLGSIVQSLLGASPAALNLLMTGILSELSADSGQEILASTLFIERSDVSGPSVTLWTSFEEDIRCKARFFSEVARNTLQSVFDDIVALVGTGDALQCVGAPGSDVEFYRGRIAFSRSEIEEILKAPGLRLGPPPSSMAGHGRMNPRFVTVFYGATKFETCLAELRAPVGSAAVIAPFRVIRPLRLLDLTELSKLLNSKVSPFSRSYETLLDRRGFLNAFLDRAGRAVVPSDSEAEYLPTQAIAEYLSEDAVLNLDGLIYPSPQAGSGASNVVLFYRASRLAIESTELAFDRVTHDQGQRLDDLRLSVIAANDRFNDKTRRPSSAEGYADSREPALQIDPHRITINIVESAHISTRKVDVKLQGV